MANPPAVRTPTFGEGDSVAVANAYIDSEIPVGDTVVNTDVETAFATVLTYGGIVPGDIVRVTGRGVVSAVSPPAATLLWKVNTQGGTLAGTGAAVVTGGVANEAWWMELLLVAAATDCEAQGMVMVSGSATPVRGMGNTGRVGIDLSLGGTLSLRVAWSVADVGNTVTLRQFDAERLVA